MIKKVLKMTGTAKKPAQSAYIPPYWVNIAIGVSAVLFYILSEIYFVEPGDPSLWETNWESRFIFRVGCLIIFESLFHWSVHEKCIWIRFLGIPIRKIRWENVERAEYIYKWSTGARFGKMEGQGIFITLKGCPYFTPEIDALNMFQLRHPFRSFFIRFTPRNQQCYVAIFKQYYPDLLFQFGHEENLKKGKPYPETEDK